MYRTVVRSVLAVLGVTALVLSAQGLAFATVDIPAPELDGSTIAPAFAMLAAGAMMLRARVRK